VLIVIDYTGSCKSNYHTITTTKAPVDIWCICWRQKKRYFTVDKQSNTNSYKKKGQMLKKRKQH